MNGYLVNGNIAGEGKACGPVKIKVWFYIPKHLYAKVRQSG